MERGELMAVLAVLGTSAMFPLAGAAIHAMSKVSPFEMLMVRGVFGLLMLVPSVMSRKEPMFKDPEARIWILLRSFFGAFGAGMYFVGVWMLPIGNATCVLASYPAVTAVVAKIFLNEPVNWIQTMCVILVTIGGVLIAKPTFLFGGEDESGTPYAALGYFVCVLGCTSFGIQFVCGRKLSQFGLDVGVEVLVAFNIFAVIIATFALSISDGEGFQLPNTLQGWLCMIFVASCGLLIQASYDYGVRYLEASVVSAIASTEGLWAFIWELILFHQTSSPVCYVGALLVTLAIGGICLAKNESTPSKLASKSSKLKFDIESCNNNKGTELRNVTDMESGVGGGTGENSNIIEKVVSVTSCSTYGSFDSPGTSPVSPPSKEPGIMAGDNTPPDTIDF